MLNGVLIRVNGLLVACACLSLSVGLLLPGCSQFQSQQGDPAADSSSVRPTTEPGQAFRQPQQDIVALLTTPEPPEVLVHRASSMAAMLTHQRVVPWQRMSAPRLGLAGFRFNPVSGASGVDFLVQRIDLVRTDRDADQPVNSWQAAAGTGLAWVQFSPDGRFLSAVQISVDGPARLALFNIEEQQLELLDAPINAAWGNPCEWQDQERMLCRVMKRHRGEPPLPRPAPIIAEHNGPPLPTRTYSNLLTDDDSIDLFEYYFASELAFVSVQNELAYTAVEAGMISSFEVSPDGHYTLLTRVLAPYSKLVQANKFPRQVEVWDARHQKRLYRSPVFGFGLEKESEETAEDPTSIAWAPQSPVLAGYIQQYSDGDGNAIYDWRMLRAPFTSGAADAVTIATSEQPIKEFGWSSAGTPWYITSTGKRGEIAVYAVLQGKPKRVWKGVRGSDDSSNAIRVNGREGVVLESNGEIFLAFDALNGKSPRSSINAVHLQNGQSRKLYISEEGVYEPVLAVLDDNGDVLLTQRESALQSPTLMRREGGVSTVLHGTPEPYPQLRNVTRQRIEYTRKDGVPLSALLYTPNQAQPKPLPTLIWIYPHEFYDPVQAGLLDVRQFQYHRIKGPSPVAAVLAGYAVILYPSIPVIHEAGEESDAYMEQLITSSDAVVDYLVKNGISDPDRIAVGGHSFGAFSSANLLIHSDRYATAIAMSGAYNRTLTPFGFQHEKRSFWEASEFYADISPFYHADQFKKPILLIHGGKDPNPGTPTMQARRLFHALAGEGVTTRYVELPNEEHQYTGRETLLHASWELINWLDTHLK